jgi:hypothetical protein
MHNKTQHLGLAVSVYIYCPLFMSPSFSSAVLLLCPCPIPHCIPPVLSHAFSVRTIYTLVLVLSFVPPLKFFFSPSTSLRSQLSSFVLVVVPVSSLSFLPAALIWSRLFSSSVRRISSTWIFLYWYASSFVGIPCRCFNLVLLDEQFVTNFFQLSFVSMSRLFQVLLLPTLKLTVSDHS